MGFAFTLLFVTISLVSPQVLPDFIMRLHVNRILMVGALAGTMFELTQVSVPRMPEAFLLVGLVAAIWMSHIANGWFGGAVDAFLSFLPSAAVFFLVAVNCSNTKRLRIMARSLVLVSLYVACHFILANLLADGAPESNVRLQMVGDETVQRYQGRGILSDPNDSAQMFLSTLPFLFIGWHRMRTLGRLVLALIPTGLLIAGVLLTRSRGAVVAFCAVLLVGFRRRLGVLGSSVVAIVGACSLLVLDIAAGRGLLNDDGGRMSAWSNGLAAFKAAPVFGVGFSRFADFNDTGMTAHNSFVLVLSELGVFGYFFWLGLLVFAICELQQISRPRYVEFSLQVPNLVDGRLTALPDDAPEASADGGPDGDVRELAFLVQTALLAFLAAAFFLSRSYVIHLYVLLGAAVGVSLVHRRLHHFDMPMLSFLGRTGACVAGSVAALYAMVRINNWVR